MGTKDSVSGRTYTTLQGQEGRGDDTTMHVLYEELCHIVTDLVGDRIAVFEGASLIRDVTLNNTCQLAGRELDIGLTDTVTHMLDRNSLAVRRIQWLIYVVDKLGVRIVEAVQLQDNTLLCQTYNSWRDTTGSCQITTDLVAYLLDVTHLDDSPIHITQETIAQLLRHLREMNVIVSNLTLVHVLTIVGVGGVRSTILDSLLIRQYTISTLTGRSTSENTYLEGTTCCMLSRSNLCQLTCYSFCSTCRSKATKTKAVIMLDQ